MNPRLLCLFLGTSLCLLPYLQGTIVLADDRSPTPQAGPFECRWADGPIVLDGRLDEADWEKALPIDRFSLPWLGENSRLAHAATRAKLLWDREGLYFAADLDDADLFADVIEHDGKTWSNDVFELFFKPADDKPGYYEFQVNAAGTRLDMFLPQRGAGGFNKYRGEGQFDWQTKVQLRGTLNQRDDKDSGWTIEGRIPWSDFFRSGGRPAIGEEWKFALCRYDYAIDKEPELSTCAPLKTKSSADFHFYEDYAALRFVGPDPKQATLPYGVRDFVPLTTSRVVGSPDPPPPYRVKPVYPNLKLNFPIAVVHQPGSDRLWLITQDRSYTPTIISRLVDTPDASQLETLLKSEQVAYDITFHPDFAQNGFVYIGSNGPSEADKKVKATRVTRYTMDPKPPYTFDAASEKLFIEWPSDGHNGGALCFGNDRMLYITSGDGTSDSDTNVTGQDMTLLLAKVLRIDVDHPDPGRAYSVPRDNPFVGMPGIRPETWAYGLRNPWRMTCDRQTGHIWVGNNGQDHYEQIYFIRPGDNYGWSVMEGSHPFYLQRTPGPTPFVKPALEHPHSEARSLTGGIVYYGQKFPELRGAYIYGDYSTGKIWATRHDGQKVTWHQELADSTLAITGFGTDSHGEILICDHRADASLYTLEPSPKDLPPSNFPRKLSESGLFQSVQGHVVRPGVVPYSVNSPLWSDGAYKERYLAIPGENPQIEFHRTRPWGLPEQTVLIKSFALEMEEGNSASRRWIETRFLTKQEGEWVGYSYIWNDEQTDATLVAREGVDREFIIRTRGADAAPGEAAPSKAGTRKQVWRYPSRAECMVCHSRAANYVLGVTTPQMNKVHDYGGVRDNQLRTLESLGLLRVNYADDLKTGWREAAEKAANSEAGTAANPLGDAAKDKPKPLDQLTTRGQRQPRSTSLLSFAPEAYPRLADPYDQNQDVALRARSYLHSNCAQCHQQAGGGNSQIELQWTTDLEKMRLVDVKPVHHTFGLPDARIVAPGHPERSVLLHRLSHRTAGHMPPLATSQVDEEAVKLIREWIAGMPPEASSQPR